MKNSPATLQKRNELKRKWKKEINVNSFPHNIFKVCNDCGELKLCGWQSSFTQTGKPEYRARCNDCYKIYLHKIRTDSNYKKLRNIRRKPELLSKKRKAISYLGGKCIRCGYNKTTYALTFHHRNKNDKECDVGKLLDYSWVNLKRELDKCDLMCFNCHMELHGEENENI